MSERIINQDLLIKAIIDLNDAINNLFALRMLNDEIELSNEPCDVEEATVALTVRQMIVRLIFHLARQLKAKEPEAKV